MFIFEPELRLIRFKTCIFILYFKCGTIGKIEQLDVNLTIEDTGHNSDMNQIKFM